MALVDASILIDHFRVWNPVLRALLEDQAVLAHPYVIDELALGRLPGRSTTLDDLNSLPKAVMASDSEVLGFFDRHELVGSGIGYIDVHLLAATRLTVGSSIWTRDRRLMAVAARMNLAFAAAP